MDENKFGNQSQWEKVLAILNKETDEQTDHTGLSQEEQALLDELRQVKALSKSYTEAHHFNTELKWAELQQELQPAPLRRNFAWYKYAAAAVVLLFFAPWLYLQLNTQKEAVHAVARHDIQPGRNKAILTLANGRKISLTDAQNGQLSAESGIVITKSRDGQVVYTMTADRGNPKQSQVTYNSIETPKGGQYQVNLPDGTKVWLNASSSLKYPSSFAAVGERTVVLNGEAYFEVAHLGGKPFKVKMKGYDVRVLGTSFNISNYENDGFVATSLLSGSVRIETADEKNIVLIPGQQAYMENQAGGVQVHNLDVNSAIAWKNGDFVFDKAHIFSIMKKMERWYDISVVYRGDFKGFNFSGQVSRKQSLMTVLDMLASTGKMKYRINIERKEVVLMEN